MRRSGRVGLISLLALLGGAAAFTLNGQASAATVTYTEAYVNSYTTVNDPAPDQVRDDNGTDLQLGPFTGVNNLGFTNGAGNYVIKQVTDAAFSKASLQSGTLKTKAVLQLGPNIAVGGSGVPLGVRNGSASGVASFADSFRAYSGNTPFLWSSGTTATFHFGVTGQFTVNGTVPNPVDYAPPKPIDLISALLTVNIYKAGTIDLLRQVKDFDFGAYPDFPTALAAYLALNDQIQANLITHDYWYFGQLIADFGADPAKILPIDAVTPTDVEFSFTPAGDFDWVATLDTTVQLDANLQSVGATLDFSNSLVSSYAGPAGTTTYSGSGVFPSTAPFSQIPPPSTGKCPRPQGYWKNNSAAWPVAALTLGSQTYSKIELLKLLGAPGGGDASQILSVQLIAAKLNLANGADPAPIAATITHADGALAAFGGKLPYKVKPSTTPGQSMTADAGVLDGYNNKLLTPTCTP